MRRLVLPAWATALSLVIDWLRDLHTAGDVGFTAARGFALALAAYLAAATVITVVLALFRVRVRLPLMPLLIVASLSAPLATPAAFAASTTTTTSIPAPPVMHRLDTSPSTTTPSPTTTTTTLPPTTTRAPSPVPPRQTAAPVVSAPGTWKVRHGECLWTISRKVLTARLGRAPTNAEIARYWRPLIEANRSRLARPGDPSLLFAGQELVLP